jgi:hypothetical protein
MKPNPRRKAQDIQYHWNHVLIQNLSNYSQYEIAKTQALHEIKMIISIMESNFFTKIIFYKQIKFYKQARKHIQTGV